ncbi:MAG TPA: Rossmann-like and DUF2520 domain-containing protein [Spirochaetia bacterium]|nr:Rossmann-like and DUF2520 domain-containing protein [Spirochaetia bacterium]
MTKPALAFVGTGKVGSALAIRLHQRGYPVAAVYNRTVEKADKVARETGAVVVADPAGAARLARVVFITTSDGVIGTMDGMIKEGGGYRQGQVAVHTSGAQRAAVLQGAGEAGALTLSVHPLQSFAGLEAALQNLPGSWFAVEGDEEAFELAREMVGDLDGRVFQVDTAAKPLYHAAACVASNYLVALMYLATGWFGEFGLGREEALDALWPLVRGTLNNMEKVGVARALTGPVERGDASTIAGHLAVLASRGGQEEDLYRRLGRYTVGVARAKGSIDEQTATVLENLFLGKNKIEED